MVVRGNRCEFFRPEKLVFKTDNVTYKGQLYSQPKGSIDALSTCY